MAKVYRYSVTAFDRGVQCVANIHYQTDVGIGGAEPSPETVLTQLDQHYSSSGTNMSKWLSLLQNGAQLTESRVYEEVEDPDATPPTGAVHTYALGGTQGPLGGDANPVELCAMISLTTDKLGRSFRGGFHSFPLPSTALLSSTGQLDTSALAYVNYTNILAAAIDQLEDVFGGAGTGDINPVIYSKTRRARGLSFAEKVTGGRVRTQLRWLRQRATAP